MDIETCEKRLAELALLQKKDMARIRAQYRTERADLVKIRSNHRRQVRKAAWKMFLCESLMDLHDQWKEKAPSEAEDLRGTYHLQSKSYHIELPQLGPASAQLHGGVVETREGTLRLYVSLGARSIGVKRYKKAGGKLWKIEFSPDKWHNIEKQLLTWHKEAAEGKTPLIRVKHR